VLSRDSRCNERQRSRHRVVAWVVDLDDHRRWRFAAAGKGEHCIGWIISKQRLPAVGKQPGADQGGVSKRSVRKHRHRVDAHEREAELLVDGSGRFEWGSGASCSLHGEQKLLGLGGLVR